MSIKFGIEIEVLLGSLKAQNSSQATLFREIKDRLSEAGIRSSVSKTTDRSEERYKAWSITAEVTVQAEPSQCLRAYRKPSTGGGPQLRFIYYAAMMNSH
jgi:hypothetical protein